MIEWVHIISAHSTVLTVFPIFISTHFIFTRSWFGNSKESLEPSSHLLCIYFIARSRQTEVHIFRLVTRIQEWWRERHLNLRVSGLAAVDRRIDLAVIF